MGNFILEPTPPLSFTPLLIELNAVLESNPELNLGILFILFLSFNYMIL
nr:MAG TPA: hypothetical protein [Caudoviricetes sp.]